MSKKKKHKKQQRQAQGNLRLVYPQKRHLYWAYGSNLSFDEMRKRCPNAEPYRAFYARGARLVFRDVADVELPGPGSTVTKKDVTPGGLWWITEDCERCLDRYEGYPTHYRKQYFEVDLDGVKEVCFFYQMVMEGVMPPSEAYLDRIVRGYRDFGLKMDRLCEAVERSSSQKRRTPELLARWERKGRQPRARTLLG